MSEIGVAKFIAAVGLHFPRPKFSEDEDMETAWMASMTRALGRYDDSVLAEAAQRIISGRKPKRDGKFFPVPSECTEVCEDIVRLLEMVRTPLLPKRSPPEYSDERVALATDLIRGEMGRRAAEEGWVSNLHEFCRVNLRLPANESEIAPLKRVARAFDEAYEACVRGDAGELSAKWEKLGASMLRRREQLAEKV